MPNNYFQFKQFKIVQERSAMKVCTDACLFGAWVAKMFTGQHLSILDVGSGTGLLSLMLAQKTEGSIHAVEIDNNAAEEAASNFAASGWSDRLKVFPTGIQEFFPECVYDLIICNPPFYEGDLKSPDQNRNTALHSEFLSLEELLVNIQRLIPIGGHVAILIAERRGDEFESLCQRFSLYITEKVLVRQSPQHSPFRRMYLLESGTRGQLQTSEIGIKEQDNNYSNAFRALLEDYYLNL